MRISSRNHFVCYVSNSMGIIFLALCLVMTSAWSATTSHAVTAKSAKDIFTENLAAAGVTFTQSKPSTKPQAKTKPAEPANPQEQTQATEQAQDALDITIDENTAVNALPGLEAQGVIPKIVPADLARAPLGMSVAVLGVSFTVVIIDSIYTAQADTNKLHVQAFVLPIGSKQKQLCYSFDYDRDQYKKLDLNKLTPKSFMMGTAGFTFTDWCRANMEKEGKKKS